MSLASLRLRPAANRRRAVATLVAIGALAGSARLVRAADPVFDGKGFSPNREFVSDLSFEHVDPLNGNLLLTFTDLVLAGNAGFDLRIQRTYNVKIYDLYASNQTYHVATNDPAGLGWTMHFGKLTGFGDNPPRPVIEASDGSSHPTFLHMDGSARHFMTRDLWTLDLDGSPCNIDTPGNARCPLLRLPNGLRYVFSYGNPQVGPLWVADILDPFGNRVHIQYDTYVAGAPAYIQWAEQRFKTGETRRVDFTYQAALTGGATVKALQKIQFGNRIWTYTQQAAGGQYTLLQSVTPPVGPKWTFDYYGATWPGPYLVQKVTTPHGGWSSYAYQAQAFYYGSSVAYSPALATRQTGGAGIVAGTTTYAFSQQVPYWDQPVVATVTEPCRTTVYQAYAIGPSGDEQPWRIGALKQKTVQGGGASQTEIYEWTPSVPISAQPESGNSFQTHAPLLSRRTVQRDGASYVTTHDYHASAYSAANNRSFNDYGNAETTTETGQLTRTTNRTFFRPTSSELSLGNYIAGKVQQETVTVASESFTRTYDYDTTGFLNRDDHFGVVTTFSANAGGNVKEKIDALGNRTTYSYQWGVVSEVRTPEYSFSRLVNSDSTVASVTRRGFTRSFTYDGLFRPTYEAPPAGNAINTLYDNTLGAWMRVSRGPAFVTTNLDGFGRLADTINAVNVRTDVNYDACGRKVYESLPFAGALTGVENVGVSYQYDGLDRVVRATHADGAFVAYQYGLNGGGREVRVTDEEGRLTVQTWAAFGDPDDGRLVSVTDASGRTTNHAYNALGSLTQVTPPEGNARVWDYDTRSLLESETHPENGTITYAYDAAGNLTTRVDPEFGTTRYRYDRNNRLLYVDFPGSQHDITLGYDASDNRTLVRNSFAESRLIYDGADRLDFRTDILAGATFTLDYSYDGNDNLQQIVYPSGGRVAYTYDAANRVTGVTNAASRTFADTFAYHPSGAIASYRAGNGLTHSATFDPKRYWIRSMNVGGVLQLGYDVYDNVGNLKTLTDSRLGAQTFTYDALDRLQTGSGSWGNLSFTYDPLGNRLTKTLSGAQTSYTYDGTTKRLVSATGAEPGSFAYDHNGNLRSDSAASYTYTPANMQASSTVQGSLTRYLYDGDNLRRMKVANGVTHYYFHGPGGQLQAEMEQAGNGPVLPVRDYVTVGSRLIASVKPGTLVVSRTVLNFVVPAGAAAPPAQAITISDSSGTSLIWGAAESLSWLSVSAASGYTPATLSVSVNPAGLQVGTYVGTLTISAAGATGSPRPVTVRLVITNGAGLVVAPSSLSFSMAAHGSNPVPASMEVLNSGGGSTPWDAQSSAAWLSVTPTTGGGMPGSLTASVNGDSLAPGTYRATITVTAPGATGSPRIVPVELAVQPEAGASCVPNAWYCEPFDTLAEGDIRGQAGWENGSDSAQVIPDPRGAGNVLSFDPAPQVTVQDAVFLADHSIDGLEVSVQLMTRDVPDGTRQVAKIEFFTRTGTAWGKTTRTFGALRFGASLLLQYGPNINYVLLDRMESRRWYAVRVVYKDQRIDAYVDGELRFSTTNPLAPGLPLQGFGTTGWDFPGAAALDLIQARPLPSGLVVEPATLRFKATVGGSGGGMARVIRGSSKARMARSETGDGRRRLAAERLPKQDDLKLPIHFEPALDSTASAPAFVAKGQAYAMRFTSSAVDLSFTAGSALEPGGPAPTLLRMAFKGASGSADIEPVVPLPGRSHYFLGSDPASWRRDLPHYGQLRYRDVYPGIDLVFYGHEGQLEYDVIVKPGADPGAIRLGFEGADRLSIDGGGHLVIEANGGRLRQLKPVVYQEAHGRRQPVSGRYVVRGHDVAFAVGAFDPSLPLVMDPVLSYATLLGGSTSQMAGGVAVDDDGYVYVTGFTSSADFPQVNPAQPGARGGYDSFITKIDPMNSRIIYSTYIGGSLNDYGVGPWNSGQGARIALDADRNVWIAGLTSSPDFPTLNAYQASPRGVPDAFLVKLNRDGALAYSTYLGGSGQESPPALAVDRLGSVYLAMHTYSSDLPSGTPFGGYSDVFIAKFGPLGTLDYSTYLGGSSQDWAQAIAVDGSGRFYVTGQTYSANFPLRRPLQDTLRGSGDAFVTRFNAAGGLDFSTFLGGTSASDLGTGIATDASGNILVTGWTLSGDFPLLNPFQSVPHAGSQEAFVAKISPGDVATPASLLFSTYLGGSTVEQPSAGIVVDAAGNAYVSGTTVSSDFPLVRALRACTGSYSDIYLTKFDPVGQAVYSTCLGSSFNDADGGLALDPDGNVYVSGSLGATDFPLLTPLPGSSPYANVLIARISDTAGGGPLFQFGATGYRVSEDAGQAVIVVTRKGDLSSTVSVDYTTSDGTATAPGDYTATSGRLTFGPGESALAFVVPIVDDSLAEADETLTLTLQNPSSGTSLGLPNPVTLTIEDDDSLTRTIRIKDRLLVTGPNWQATEDIPWLTLSAYSGIGPSAITATVDPAGLAAGTYTGTIVVTGNTGDSPQFVQVTLTAQP